MHVPIPVVIFLVLAVVGGVWFGKTRGFDFMSPPSEARLNEIRVKVESSFPQADQPEDAISVPTAAPEPPPEPVKVKPSFDLGDLGTPPTLAHFAERADLGADHLAELAKRLEAGGYFQRALLAWERVLDHTAPDAGQAADALRAIRRLRPTLPNWNTESAQAVSITIQAGTGRTVAQRLAPILEEVARELELASSGTVKVQTHVTAGRDLPGTTPSPVALWLGGPEKDSATTEVLSFTAKSPERLRQEVLNTLYLLLRGELDRSTDLTPPAELAADADPREALEFQVTRLGWKQFAETLNRPLKKGG
ncbi:MAG: hypothetical protein WED15_06275 [Akkermansiaceae bacterium]